MLICVYSYPNCSNVSIKTEVKEEDHWEEENDAEYAKRFHQSRWNFAKSHIPDKDWDKPSIIIPEIKKPYSFLSNIKTYDDSEDE